MEASCYVPGLFIASGARPGVVIMLIASLDFRDQLIASRLQNSNDRVTARFKPASPVSPVSIRIEEMCYIVAGPRKKGVLMMHGLVKEPSVVHLGEGLGLVALANQ